jgi:hypothetical protein
VSLVDYVQSTGREFHVPLYFTLQGKKWGDGQVKTNYRGMEGKWQKAKKWWKEGQKEK